MATENSRQAELMAAKRAADRDQKVPKIKNPRRRKACGADDAKWLRTYLPDVFYQPFTADQKYYIETIGEAIRHGVKQCIAAPRGDGKSSITKYLQLKYALYRQLKFPLLVCATGSKAISALDSIKSRLRTMPGNPLYDDFPLECHLARYVAPAPSRANNVTVNGRKVNLEWNADSIILPTYDDEAELGPIIMALGFTSDSIQGCNVYDRRPDFVMLDDLDSRDSLAAEDGKIAGKIEECIDKNIAGLGGPGKKLGQVYLCTITSTESAAAKYSDPEIKPAWSGTRVKRIKEMPTEYPLWDQYMALRQRGKSTIVDGKPIDRFGREAFRLYKSHRGEMDAGFELSNPYDFDSSATPDGSPVHLSALQKCFDYIADYGWESFRTEHQNDPPEDSGPIESGISAFRILKKLSGFAHQSVPPGCTYLTQGIDVGKRYLHWVVRAWRPEGDAIYTIDYGTQQVYGVVTGSEDGLDDALREALTTRMEQARDTIYTDDNGNRLEIGMTLVDARYRTAAIYSTCESLGLGIRPVMGYGKSSGCVRGAFSEISRRTIDRRPGGDGWFESRQNLGGGKTLWLVNIDADRWKSWEHDRWMTAPDKHGCMWLYGSPGEDAKRISGDEIEHQRNHYPAHICAEIEVEENINGAIKRYWKVKGENHWLDASSYANVAAQMLGATMHAATRPKRGPPGQRKTLAEMAGK